MLITISKGEFKSIEETLECIGLETIKVEKALGIITGNESLYYIDSLKFPTEFSPEEIQNINDTYGVIIRVAVVEDDYTIWINPDFIIDYMELYRGVTVGIIKTFIDSYNTIKLLIKPMIESFVSKWNSMKTK